MVKTIVKDYYKMNGVSVSPQATIGTIMARGKPSFVAVENGVKLKMVATID
jgi:hypothetical protein